jgi:hypothetical protein
MDTPLALHGVGRVDQQVDHHLLKLCRIGIDLVVVHLVIHHQSQLRVRPGCDQLARLLNQAGPVQAPQLGRCLAAEGQQLAHQAIGVTHGLLRLLQGLLAGVAVVQVSAASRTQPVMAASELLKSWAMPPVRRPSASVFWLWASWACRLPAFVTPHAGIRGPA